MATSEDMRYPMRLQRFLARAGVASRRGSERLMTEGRVCVNGEVVRELGSKVDPLTDFVTVDGQRVEPLGSHTSILLNKPAGYLTTMSDPYGRPCVASLVPCEEVPGLFPVGRLDADTTGLLLFTTNGMLAQNLLHPSRHVDKTYLALVEGVPDEKALSSLREGVMLEDGLTSPAKVELVDGNDRGISLGNDRGVSLGNDKGVSLGNDRGVSPVVPGDDSDSIPISWGQQGIFPYCSRSRSVVSITIHEGKKHQVKRMLEAVGHPVVALHRRSFGPLVLTDEAEGSWRALTSAETEALMLAAGMGEGDAL